MSMSTAQLEKNNIKGIVISLFLGALAFTMAMAWNGMIEAIIQQYAVENKHDLKGKVTYALIVTILGIIAVYVLKRARVI